MLTQILSAKNIQRALCRSNASRRHYRVRYVSPRVNSTASGPSTAQMPVSRLLKYYYEVQHPAYANKRYSDAMLDFVNEAMLAYECGYKESDLQATLTIALEEQLQSFPGTFKGAEDEGFLDECLHCIVLVWTTLIISPRSLKRWATEKAVSEDSFSAWRGFVSMIVHAYFEKRMAWYPIDRLSLELTAVFSKSESPHVVAERARIVFTTLERVFPQFPSL